MLSEQLLKSDQSGGLFQRSFNLSGLAAGILPEDSASLFYSNPYGIVLGSLSISLSALLMAVVAPPAGMGPIALPFIKSSVPQAVPVFT